MDAIQNGSVQKVVFIYQKGGYRGTTIAKSFVSHIDQLESASKDWKILIYAPGG